MDRDAIEALLPHRDPFLLVDRVLELDAGTRAVGELDVREDAFWVPGHFPGHPVLPGVLIAEALAQTAALAYLTGHPERQDDIVYLVGFDKVRFRRPVRPGETLRLEATLERERRRLCSFRVAATVEGERTAEGSLLASVAPAAG